MEWIYCIHRLCCRWIRSAIFYKSSFFEKEKPRYLLWMAVCNRFHAPLGWRFRFARGESARASQPGLRRCFLSRSITGCATGRGAPPATDGRTNYRRASTTPSTNVRPCTIPLRASGGWRRSEGRSGWATSWTPYRSCREVLWESRAGVRVWRGHPPPWVRPWAPRPVPPSCRRWPTAHPSRGRARARSRGHRPRGGWWRGWWRTGGTK